jgi:hypothetical protein
MLGDKSWRIEYKHGSWLLHGETTSTEEREKLWDKCCDFAPYSAVRMIECTIVMEEEGAQP